MTDESLPYILRPLLSAIGALKRRRAAKNQGYINYDDTDFPVLQKIKLLYKATILNKNKKERKKRCDPEKAHQVCCLEPVRGRS